MWTTAWPPLSHRLPHSDCMSRGYGWSRLLSNQAHPHLRPAAHSTLSAPLLQHDRADSVCMPTRGRLRRVACSMSMCELRVMHGRPTIDIAACSPTRPHGAKCMRPSPGRLNSASVCPECMHPPRPTHAWPVSQPLEIEREISRERARSLQPAATRDSCGGRRARPTQS